MELIICIIVGIICVLDRKFDKKNILGEMINIVIYLFFILIAMVTFDFIFFGKKINMFSNEYSIVRVIVDIIGLVISIFAIKYFRVRDEITIRGKRIYLFLISVCFLGTMLVISYDMYAKNGIVINEVSSNNHIYYDEDDMYSGDYIELYNPSYTLVELDGYVLTDGDYECDLSGYSIPPDGYIVFSTSNLDNYLGFSISANGEMIALEYNGREIDCVEVPEVERDTFYVREKDGMDKWLKVTEATPNQSNNNAINSKFPLLNEPIFSLECGFYDEPIEVEIFTEYKDCKIYYTLDGTEPTTESLVYSGPIKLSDYSVMPNKYSAIENTSAASDYLPNYLVDKANVLKAMVVDENGEKSKIATNTYFINFDEKIGYENVMVMSMIIDEKDFFSEDKGIYVLGKSYIEWLETQDLDYDLSEVPFYSIPANYYIRGKKSERDVSIELFDSSRNLMEESEGVIKILGGASRGVLNKSLVLNSCDESSLFYNEKYSLRSRDVIFSEAFTQSLVYDRKIGIQNNIGACALFINGEYWGTYMLQERSKAEYFENNFDVQESNLVVIENGAVDIGDERDIELYEELMDICKLDCTMDENYNKICEMIDIQSLIDYFCFNLYVGNIDWPYNNYSCWRSRNDIDNSEYQDGIWRWNVFDVDFGGLQPYRYSFAMEANISKKRPLDHPIIKQLIKNPDFKKEFVKTFLDLANYNFSPNIVLPKIDVKKELYLTSIINNNKRFVNENYSIYEAENEVRVLYDFYIKRYDFIVPNMAKELGLTGTLEEVTLEVNDVNGGNITLNTITPELNSDNKWTGRYYTDYTVTVTANPKDGYRFVGWEGTYTDSNETMEVAIVPGGVTVKAIFEKIN